MTLPLAHLSGSEINALELLPLAVIALAYARRSIRLAARGQAPATGRQLSFAAGLLVFALAIGSPLGHLNEELFSAHTVQHLLITDAAALLVVVGLTGPILQPLLRIPVLRWLRTFANPLVALPLWVLNLYIWHLPPLYELALGNSLVHGLQHALFFGLSAMLWMPLFGPLPRPPWFGDLAQFVYIVGFRFGGVILGNFLIWSGFPIYGAYSPGAQEWDINPLADQGIGGAIMGVENILLTLGLVVWLALRFARHDEAAQQLVDYAFACGVELEKGRARRAVAAGWEDELRRKVDAAAASASPGASSAVGDREIAVADGRS